MEKELTRKIVFTNYKTRMRDRPEFYTEDMKRIIYEVDNTLIDVHDHDNDLNLRDTINIFRGFLGDLDETYLNLFNYLISKNLITLKGKNKRNLKQMGICYHDNGEIKIKYNSTDYLLHTLSHEMGHSIYNYEPNSLRLEAAYNETISQLFPYLLKDYLKTSYPSIDLIHEEQKQFNYIFDSFGEVERKRIKYIYNFNKDKYPYLDNGKDVWGYEKDLTYLYSYYLTHILHEDYKKTKSLKNIRAMINLSMGGYLETDELVREMGFDKDYIGSKKMQKEIRSKLK